MIYARKISAFLLMAIMALPALHCHAGITFKFDSRSSVPSSIKNAMEYNLSQALTEINRAGESNTPLNLSGVQMEEGARQRLSRLWDQAIHFTCKNTLNVTKCIEDMQGYQVRNIPVTVIPVNETYTESLNRELTVSFDRRGTITGIRPSRELEEDRDKFMAEGLGVLDARQRMEVLKWVEDFRCYYNERNYDALNLIYSEDALIITGSVIKKAPNTDGVIPVGKVKYTKKSKIEYMQSLKRIFDRRVNKVINVKFDHISLVKHSSKENVYGVTLRQDWHTSTYSDTGWLFLIWDFSKPDQPQILVRTWQPEEIKNTNGLPTLPDFFIP